MPTNASAGRADATAGKAASGPKIAFPKRRVSRAVAREELALLERAYPDTATALDYVSPFTLLVAVILSAQCTDARVNLTTPHLFAAYPTPEALGAADPAEIERIVKSCGFFRMKAKNIIAASAALANTYGGEVPRDREALEALPGVGRKTASVVLAVAFSEAAFAVDTHVYRVSRRLGLTLGTTPRAVEDDVVALVEPEKLRHAHHWLIVHGRSICKAPVPHCPRCFVRDLCPSAPIVTRVVAKRVAASVAKRTTSAKNASSRRQASARPRPTDA